MVLTDLALVICMLHVGKQTVIMDVNFLRLVRSLGLCIIIWLVFWLWTEWSSIRENALANVPNIFHKAIDLSHNTRLLSNLFLLVFLSKRCSSFHITCIFAYVFTSSVTSRCSLLLSIWWRQSVSINYTPEELFNLLSLAVWMLVVSVVLLILHVRIVRVRQLLIEHFRGVILLLWCGR